MNTSPRNSPISNAMSDPNRADYGIRVGHGVLFNFRGSLRLLDLFPDGCRISAKKNAGQYELTLLNRVTGISLSVRNKGVPVPFMDTTFPSKELEGEKLPQFGAVAPEQVVSIPGGLVLRLPAQLPAKQVRKVPRGMGGKSKEALAAKAAARAAAKPDPSVASLLPLAAKSATPAPSVAEAPAARTALAAPRPAISLREAVEAVNGWKRYDPANLDLSVGADGLVEATAQYK